MFFKIIETGNLAHYSYIVGDGNELAVIDPMRDVSVYMKEARKQGMRIKYILETHRNEDYVIGSMELSEKTRAKILISGHEELGHVYGEKISDGHEITLGDIRIRALHTPGHTLGHMSFVVFEGEKKDPYMVFTGDCLFMGDLGRTDFYGEENLGKMTGLLYDSVFNRLLPLGDEVLMFPAHGAGSACGDSMDERPFSTLGYERKSNPHLQVDSKEEFIKNFAKMRIKPRYFEKMEVLNVKGGEFVGEDIVLNALTIEEFKGMKDDVLAIDIRKKEGFIGGHIPGTIYMSPRSVTSVVGSLFNTEEKVVLIIDNNTRDLEDVYWYLRRIGFDNIIGYVQNAIDMWEESGEEINKLFTMSSKKFMAGERDEDYILLDIRKMEELEEDDPSENRINIPIQILYDSLDRLDKEKTIYILCGSGEKATVATSYLYNRGYKSIVLTGGARMLKSLRKKEDI